VSVIGNDIARIAYQGL